MSNKLGGKQGTAYLGTNADQPPNWVFAFKDPTQYDVNNVSLGDLWLNQDNETVWVLVSLAGIPGSHGSLATWSKLESGAGLLNTLTGNSGGVVSPDGSSNINGLKIYLNGQRVDDPNFDAGNATNILAQMNSLQGDGSTKTVDISMLETDDGDTIIVRKSTSDGAFLPDPNVVDTLVKGGDLAYSTAQGINAEDINIDGDGFVTETSAKGPEEFVPGQVLDTLDIQDNTKVKHFIENCIYNDPNTDFFLISNNKNIDFEAPKQVKKLYRDNIGFDFGVKLC